MPDGDFKLRRRVEAPGHLDTMEVGWEAAVAEALLEGDDVRLYDWPTRRWLVIRASGFRTGLVLPRLRRILRDDFGVVAGRGGRQR